MPRFRNNRTPICPQIDEKSIPTWDRSAYDYKFKKFSIAAIDLDSLQD